MLPKPLQHSSCFSLSAWESAVFVIPVFWSKSLWSDFFWSVVLGGVQRVSGLLWRKIGSRQVRDLKISEYQVRISASPSAVLREPSWTQSASLQWYGQRCPCIVENVSCSSVLAPRNCHSLSDLECGFWGLCCSCAGSSLEFVPPERPTYLSVRVTWVSDAQLLLHPAHPVVEIIQSCFLQSYLSFPTFCGVHKLHNCHWILSLFPGCWWK